MLSEPLASWCAHNWKSRRLGVVQLCGGGGTVAVTVHAAAATSALAASLMHKASINVAQMIHVT